MRIDLEGVTTLAKCGSELYAGFSWLYCEWGARGLAVVSEKDPEKISYFHSENSGLNNNCVNKVKFDGEKIWIGTFDGLYYMDPETKKIYESSFSSEKNNPQGRHINDMLIEENVIWLATDGGLMSYEKKTGKMKLCYSSKQKTETGYSSVCSCDGLLWLGRDDEYGMDGEYGNTLQCFNPQTKATQFFEVGPYITALASYGKCVFIARTGEGGVFLLPKQEYCVLLSINHLMTCVHIGRINEKAMNYLWFGSSSDGIYCIPFGNEVEFCNIYKLPQENGVREECLNLLQEDKYIYICKSSGIEKYEIEKLISNCKKFNQDF